MTMALAYNSDLSRVQVALNSLNQDGTITVERSANQLHWRTVRGAVELEVDAGTANPLDDFEFETDIENFYRARPLDPPAGLLMPGASGDYASTPDAAALDVAGDIELRAWVKADDWDALAYLVTKYDTSTNQRSYALRIRSGRRIGLNWSTDGTSFVAEESTAPFEPGADGIALAATLDVDNGASGYTVRFWTAPTMDGPWTQLGDTIIGGATTSIFASTADLRVGEQHDGTNTFAGSIFAIQVLDGVGGTAVADADFAAQSDSAGSFTGDDGLLWTINGTAAIVGPLLDSGSITPSLSGQVWLKSVLYPFLNRPVYPRTWGNVRRPSRSRLTEVQRQSAPLGRSDLRGSRRFDLELLTREVVDVTVDGDEDARNLDLLLASGDVFFIHVPASRRVPGGYVLIDADVQEEREVRAGDDAPRRFVLRCTTVEPPAPDVVGASMTYAGLFNVYGSYDNVLLSGLDYRDLLDLVSDPEDPVTL